MNDTQDQELAATIARLRLLGAEPQRVEVKAAEKGLGSSVWESVSAFANTAGGTLILGLDESVGFAPVKGFQASKRLQSLHSGLAEGEGQKVSPIPLVRADIFPFEGESLVVAEVSPLNYETSESPGPCYVMSKGKENGSFKRVGNQDRLLTRNEIFAVSSKWTEQRYDSKPVAAATVDDLDRRSIRQSIERIETSGSRMLFGAETEEQVLRRMGVLDRDGKVTTAGYLTFGQYPQQEFPQLVIDVTVHPGVRKSMDAQTRFLDRQVCDGPIPFMIDDALKRILLNLKVRREMKGAEGLDVPEIPVEVLREAVTNAVMHRDYSEYSTGTPVSVDLYPDRIEIFNPGSLWGGITPSNIFDGRKAERNQTLSRLLRGVPMPGGQGSMVEAQGSGVPRILQALEQAGLRRPTFVERDAAVLLTIFRQESRTADLQEVKSVWLEMLGELEELVPISARELAATLGANLTSLRPHLREMVDQGLIEATAPATSKLRAYVLTAKGRAVRDSREGGR
ncbi:MAG: ATP-binding protein [Buchananella hordeovulneris]|nr:ATP-binding protein [Buchananella hordeovulneris]